jgi:hypothetical protein
MIVFFYFKDTRRSSSEAKNLDTRLLFFFPTTNVENQLKKENDDGRKPIKETAQNQSNKN